MSKWYIICSLLIIVIVVESVAFLTLNNLYVSLSSDYDSLNKEYQALTVAHESLCQNYSSLETNHTNLELQFNILQMDFTILQLNYSSLEANYTATKIENSELKTQYHNLSTQFTKLGENYTALKNQYTQLTENYTTLETQFIDLSANYSSLQATYQSLRINYTDLETQYDSLQTLYDSLQAEYDRYVAAYQRLRDKINQRWDLQNVEPFVTSTGQAVNAEVLSITGGWSNTSNWDEYWDDIKAMYHWVVSNIEYRSDGLFPVLPDDPSDGIDYWDEMWQFPNETLSLRQGDCEDMAILLCSMIRCYTDMQYWAECIVITGSMGGHMAVQIPVGDDKLVIFDPAGGYYSSDWLGNIVFNNISMEIDNWLDYWKPEMGYDVYVYSIFSDYIHETFASTDDYITWMYSR